jgi:hypothetical protein
LADILPVGFPAKSVSGASLIYILNTQNQKNRKYQKILFQSYRYLERIV